MPRINRLPYIRMDENLSKITGTKDTIQTNLMIKALWQYIKKNNLKIPFAEYKG